MIKDVAHTIDVDCISININRRSMKTKNSITSSEKKNNCNR
jgi:hypothetical protein